MKITINPLSIASIESAKKDLVEYQSKLKKLAEELPKALAEFGAEYAQAGYNESAYNIYASLREDDEVSDTPNIKVTAEKTDNGWRVLADGQEVCFVEFGAGVLLNPDGGGLLPRPEGVDGIGEYGYGLGKNTSWSFKRGDERVSTFGTQAANVLFYTVEEIKNRIEETARRILSND